MPGINRSVRLDPALWDALDKVAESMGVSRNKALALVVGLGLPQLERAIGRGWTPADGLDVLIEARRVAEIVAGGRVNNG